jgi:hypothetical protein
MNEICRDLYKVLSQRFPTRTKPKEDNELCVRINGFHGLQPALSDEDSK